MSYINWKTTRDRDPHAVSRGHYAFDIHENIDPPSFWYENPAVSSVDADNFRFKNLQDPADQQDAVTKQYADATYPIISNLNSEYLRLDGTNQMQGNFNLNGHKAVNLQDPTANDQAVPLSHLQANYYTESTADTRFVHLDGSSTMNANLDLGSNTTKNLADGTLSTDAINYGQLTSNFNDQTESDAKYLKKDGSSSLTATLDMNNNKVIGLADPTVSGDALTRNYLESNYSQMDNNYLRQDGSNSFQSTINFGGSNTIKNMSDPVNSDDGVTKSYFDANKQDSQAVARLEWKQMGGEVIASANSTTEQAMNIDLSKAGRWLLNVELIYQGTDGSFDELFAQVQLDNSNIDPWSSIGNTKGYEMRLTNNKYYQNTTYDHYFQGRFSTIVTNNNPSAKFGVLYINDSGSDYTYRTNVLLRAIALR